MDASTIVMIIGAAITLAVVSWKSPEATSKGLDATAALFIEILPRMATAFIIAGLIQAVVPQETIIDGWDMARGCEAF